MIFKNKNAAHSSLFGDKQEINSPKPVDPAVLESFFRKQSTKQSESNDGGLISKTILRSSSSQDSNVPGEIFIGKKSSRSIFAPESVDSQSVSSKNMKKSEFMPEIKQEVPQDVADDLIKFKGNFSEASKSAGSHGAVRADRISIFDNSPFERVVEKKVEEVKSKQEPENKISKAMKVSDVIDSLWSKLSETNSDNKKIAREKAIDKLFGGDNA